MELDRIGDNCMKAYESQIWFVLKRWFLMRLKKETICIYDTEYVNQFCKYSGSIVKCTLTCIRHPSVWVLRSLSIFKLTHTHTLEVASVGYWECDILLELCFIKPLSKPDLFPSHVYRKIFWLHISGKISDGIFYIFVPPGIFYLFVHLGLAPSSRCQLNPKEWWVDTL